MKLLIVTQKADINDPILGFFHRWIEEFAKRCEKVTVIALGAGEYRLPNNVRVFSLGKERSASRLGFIFNFYRLIWRERKNYDVVFAHMNQEYVLLGGLFWKLLGKKITMWRNHARGGFATRVAVFLSDAVFCTSKQSFAAKFKKTKIMPVGIDTDIFKSNETTSRLPGSILFLGRISPVKNVDIFVGALNVLDQLGVAFTAGIYGDSAEKDREYYKKIKMLASDLEKKKKIIFHSAKPNTQTPPIYNLYDIFVNATPSGSFDKTIIEAMACGCLVVASNKSLLGIAPKDFLFKEGDENSLAETLQKALCLPALNKEQISTSLRSEALRHNLSDLVASILVAAKQA